MLEAFEFKSSTSMWLAMILSQLSNFIYAKSLTDFKRKYVEVDFHVQKKINQYFINAFHDMYEDREVLISKYFVKSKVKF